MARFRTRKVIYALIPIDIKVGAWMKQERQNTAQGQSKAICFPFYSVLLAMGNPVVDYFSLDVEGAELPILKSIPWDKVNIKVSIIGMRIYFIAECLK